MKRFLSLLLVLIISSISIAYADDTAAKIKINISGAPKNGHYFMCLPNVGCLNIHAAMLKGKIFSIFQPVEIRQIFVANTQSLHVSAQNTPASCQLTVKPNQTVTISGKLVSAPNDKVSIKQLRCSLE